MIERKDVAQRNQNASKSRYADIMMLRYPEETKEQIRHPRMTNADRAKIFAPFAALKGYEEAIAAKQRIVVPKIELSEEAKEELDRCFHEIEAKLAMGIHPVVTVTYFEQDGDKEVGEGCYLQFTGMVVKLLDSANILQVVDKKLNFSNICACELDGGA